MGEVKQYVAFMLGQEEYAVEILTVQEIIRWTESTRVPKAPDYIKGVINLRGTVIPVIDSHRCFNLAEQVVTDSSRIIVFHLEDTVIGMTVDMVTEVISIDGQNIEQSHNTRSISNHFMSGIGKVGDRLLIILDPARVLEMVMQPKERIGA